MIQVTPEDRRMPAETYDAPIERLYGVNLRVAPGERIVVFADQIRPEETLTPAERTRREALPHLAERIAAIGKRWGESRLVLYPAAASHGEEPPLPVWEAAFGTAVVHRLTKGGHFPKLLAKEATPLELDEALRTFRRMRQETVDVIIALANFSTSHTQFRTLATSAGRARYASMPLFSVGMFAGPMAADWRQVAARSEAVAQRLRHADGAEVRTLVGTEIRVSLRGRQGHADTGLLWKGGSFGNLPGGEAYIAPIEESAEGTLVIEHGPTGRLEAPITIAIREGRASRVDGEGAHADFLRRKFREAPLNSVVGELGVGTNDRAADPYNILEAEKILGTVHIAFGDNSGFGGTVRTPFHLDHVQFTPTLTLLFPDGRSETLLKDGRLSDDGLSPLNVTQNPARLSAPDRAPAAEP
jgi:aminopeptidase